MSPVLTPDKLATAVLASILFDIVPVAIEVILPTLVTTPVKLALVVTVAALPVILPLIGFVTVKLAKVPTEVKLELITVDFKVVPDNVLASTLSETLVTVGACQIALPEASAVNTSPKVPDTFGYSTAPAFKVPLISKSPLLFNDIPILALGFPILNLIDPVPELSKYILS